MRGVGVAPGRSRLRDRRDRDQGRRPRSATSARRAARAAPLGTRVQVGTHRRRDDAAEDPHPRGQDGRAQPVGRARARPRRGRHRLQRHAPQRGGHQPQGHPRGRPRDRPARRGRDPPGRGTRRRPREGHEAVPHAEAVPAVRRRRGQARGGGHAPLPEPRVPLSRPGDAHPLGERGHGHRGRRRAVRAPAVGRGPAALDAGSLSPHRGAARRARRLREGLRRAGGRVDRGLQGAALLARAVRAQHPEDRLGAGAQPRPPLRQRGRAHRGEPGGARAHRGDRARPRGAGGRVVRGGRERRARARARVARPDDDLRARRSARSRGRSAVVST